MPVCLEASQILPYSLIFLLVSDFSKDKLAISSCLDYHNKQFWLIHHQNKILYPISNNSNIDIDALNIELDSLLNL